MAAPVVDLSKFVAPTSVGGIKLPTTASTAKNKYVATLTPSTSPLSTLDLSNVGQPASTGITNQNVLPTYLRSDAPSSNGATSPTPTKITAPTSSTGGSSSSPGSYKGVAITPGSDADIARQIAAIDAQGSTTIGGTPKDTYVASQLNGGSTGVGTGSGGGSTGNTGASTPAQPSTYDLAMKAYLDSLTNEQSINQRVLEATKQGNDVYQADLDRPGGLLQGNQATAALDARRTNADLANLGIAQSAATNDENLAFQRLQFEQGKLPSNDPYTLSPGQARYDASGNLIASLPDDGGSEPTSVQEYQYAVQNGYQGSYTDFKNSGGSGQDPNRVLSATEAQSLGVPFGTTAGQAYGITPQKPLTESQARDLTYGQRGQQSNDIIEGLTDSIASFNPVTFAAYTKLEPNALGNAVVPDTVRQYIQAERNFLAAVLRRESGAQISASELATGALQYFPRPGDDQQTLAQKAQNRVTAVNSFLQNAGQSGVSNGSAGGSGSIWDF